MISSRSALVAAVVSAVVVSPFVMKAHAQSVAEDQRALLQEVSVVRAPGALVGTLTLLDSSAFPVVAGRQGANRAPIVAAARVARGRAVVYGHNGFLGAESLRDAGTARLLANAVRWSAGGKATVRVGLLDQEETADALRTAGFTIKPLTSADLTATGLASVDVLIANPGAFEGNKGGARVAAVQAFVRGGGGLISYGVGWGWQQLNPGRSLAEDAGFNRLLVPLVGIGCNGDTADATTGEAGYLTGEAHLPDTMNVTEALTLLEKGSGVPPGRVGSISRIISQATEVLPESDTRALPRLRALITRVGSVAPTKYAPVTPEQPLARVAAVLESRRLARTPVEQIKPHPSAAAFPGAVPAETPRLASKVVPVDTAVPDWHSTGLYAAPGEVITVTLPASAAGKGLGIRIGAHRDALWNLDTWPRFPEITVEKPITGTTLRIANAFGGTVYVTVRGKEKLGTVPVTISGAVAQPYYVKGKTTTAEWEALRSAPAPWAELCGDNLILTVPSYVVRELKNPEAVVEYWDQVSDAAADLYAIPRKRERPERFCVDIEISAGYMHSGYPIMTHDDVDRTFVSLRTLRGTDGNKTWGFYHELGHNHQRPEWTWSGMGEVTNNLFSLYGNELLNAVPTDYANSHANINPAGRRAALISYLAEGVTPDGLTKDPFLALGFFIRLRQEFGWEPFKKVFGEYRVLPDVERPKTELAKHDQFLQRFSNAVGKNLGPYFTAWGVTTSDAARNSVAGLPTWMPADWPTEAEVAAARAKRSPTAAANR